MNDSATATDHTAFLAAIHAAPDDPMPRLVYADWLDERGDPDGELVRLLCEVQRGQSELPALADELKTARGVGDGAAANSATGRSVQIANHVRRLWDRLEHVTGGLDATIERLSERDRRLFACDCAERVLPLFEREYPGDDRPRRAVETARRSIYGQSTATMRWLACGAAWDAADEISAGTIRPYRPGLVADACARTALDINGPHTTRQVVLDAADATADPAAERRWQLCRAVEYLLGFVGPLVHETD